MENRKDRLGYRENTRKRRMAELIDMEKHPSHMGESFRRPAYDGTVLCPDPARRTRKARKAVSPLKRDDT